MTPVEVVNLCRLAKAACPQQHFDEWTPEIWGTVLGDLRYEDCQAGLVSLVTVKPFCSPAEVREATLRIRRQRLDDFGELPNPPRDLPDDPRSYVEWKGDLIRRICDGEGDAVTAEYAALEAAMPKHPMPELGHIFHKVPSKT
jgi:hypothetical protein